MAFKPSERKKAKYKETEISLTSVMNLMIILIPLLVQQAFAVKLAIKPINLPTGGGGGGGVAQARQEAKLNLVVSITKNGFYIASSFGKLPFISMKADGTYDYDTLAAKLVDVKRQLDKSTMNFEDAESVIIVAEPDTIYDVVVQVMDKANWIIKTNPLTGAIEREPLFPNSMLSPGVQG